MQSDLSEAADEAAKNFEKNFPDQDDWTGQGINEYIHKHVSARRGTLERELKKLLPMCDDKYDGKFIEKVKEHYEKFHPPEMLIEKLYSLATTAMDINSKLTWLDRWNWDPKSREELKFPKLKFSDEQFNTFLNKATFWAQVNPYIIDNSEFGSEELRA